MSILISSDQLPADERFQCWRETLGKSRMAPVEILADGEADFRFELRYRDLGAIRVVAATSAPYRVRRTARLIRQSDPDLLSLGMMLRGRGTLDQGGRQAEVPAGGFIVYDVGRPYRIGIGTADGAGVARTLMVHFPRALLPLPSRQLERLTGVPMAAGQGIGALTARFLMELAGGIDHYRPADAARMATVALEVLAARLAHELDGDGWVAPEARRRVLLAEIQGFIQRHLGEPELGPGTVAAANHISVSYLHKLFHAEGITVAGWIRQRRLEGSRRDLADPALAARPVAAIGARWGFPSAARFSQVFKAAQGMAPQQYRRLVQAGGGDGATVERSESAVH